MKSKISFVFGLIFSVIVLGGILTRNNFFQFADTVTPGQSGFFDPNHPTRVAYRETRERKLVNVGRAPFAIAANKFDCKSFVSSLKDLDFVHISWLFNTFGTKYSCLNKILDDPRLITLQTNLINEPGHRNRRLEKHEFLYNISSPQKFDQLLKSRNPKLKAQFDKYVGPLQDLLVSRLQPQTECLINPGLESNVSSRAAKVLNEWAREAFPFCKIIWNPIAKANTPVNSGADLIEQHGWEPTFKTHSCTFNNDGSDINFPERKAGSALAHEKDPLSPKNYVNSGNALQYEIQEYANQCKVIYLWTVEDNCFAYDNVTAPWAPPTKRPCKVGPVNRLVAKEIKIAHTRRDVEPKSFEYTDEEEAAFAGCSEIRKPNDGAKKGFLLKQSEFSDRGGALLLPSNLRGVDSATVVYKNKKVDSYKFSGIYGHDSSGRPLWRSDVSPLKYPYRSTLILKDGNKKICYRLSNPKIRND